MGLLNVSNANLLVFTAHPTHSAPFVIMILFFKVENVFKHVLMDMNLMEIIQIILQQAAISVRNVMIFANYAMVKDLTTAILVRMDITFNTPVAYHATKSARHVLREECLIAWNVMKIWNSLIQHANVKKDNSKTLLSNVRNVPMSVLNASGKAMKNAQDVL